MRDLFKPLCVLSLVVGFGAPASAARFVITSADAGGGPHVIIRADTDQNGTFETITDSFFAFTPASPGTPLFNGGVRVATGDIDGDGNYELVTAMGPGGGQVAIWSLTGGGQIGGLIEQFAPFGGFMGGVFVAMGDLDGDGRDELVTSADAGGQPLVVAWKDADRDFKYSDDPPLTGFFPYATAFSGGVRVAIGDVNTSTPGEELITAPGPGGGPHVRVFRFNAGAFSPVDEFFAYNPAFTGGVFLAAGAIAGAGNGGAEIATSPGAGGGPHVRIFTDADGDGLVSDNFTFDEFFAYNPAFTGGVHVAMGDTDQSGFFVELLTTPGAGGGPHLRIFDDDGDANPFISDNPTDDERLVFDPAWAGGVYSAVAHFDASTWSAPLSFPQSIPDNATINSFMCLPAGSGIVRTVRVGLSIAHTFDADLDVVLTHLPTGRSVTLFTDIGGTSDGLIVMLADAAGTDIAAVPASTSGPITGLLKPEAPALLSTFAGADASGCWQLAITDDAGGDTGSLIGWTLSFAH